jgi:hypothetical protein
MIVRRIYSNAAGFPGGSVRNLKMENEGHWLLGFISVIAAHSVSPLFCVELAHLGLRNGLSWGASVACAKLTPMRSRGRSLPSFGSVLNGFLWRPKLGNPNLDAIRGSGGEAGKAEAERFAGNVLPIIKQVRKAGATTLQQIANALNDWGVATARGGSWYPSNVRNVLGEAKARASNARLRTGRWSRRTGGGVRGRFWESVKTIKPPPFIDQTISVKAAVVRCSVWGLLYGRTSVIGWTAEEICSIRVLPILTP